MRCINIHICVITIILTLTGMANAVTWTDPSGGTFQDSSNWAGISVPSLADNALFDIDAATFTVGFTGNVTNSYLLVGRSDVTFDLNGFNYALTRATPESIFIGELAFDAATLTVTDGTLSGVDATIGQVAGSSGTLNIPTGGVVNLTEDLFIGDEGVGSMDITGGQLNTNHARIANDNGSFGDVLLSGASTVWTNTNSLLMHQGNASLTVQSGAILNTSSLTVGSSFSSTADIVLDGSGSQINVTGLLHLSSVGGTSTMQIRNGADLTSGDSNIGNVGIGADAQVTVTGAGSTWTSFGKIAASLRGDAPGGHLRIENGAVVTSVTGAVGELSDSQGAAVIDGVGSQWNMTGDLEVGEGMANLSITNGGNVSNLNADIGTVSGDGRTIDILVDGPGSLWNIAGEISGGSGGNMTISNGADVTADSADTAIGFAVDGPGSSWLIANNATIDNATTTPSSITNGAFVSSDGLSITRGGLSIDNGSWNNSGEFTFTSSSTLPVRISNSGSMNNQGARMVTTAGRFATVIVEGPGSVWDTTGALEVGDAPDNGGGIGGIASLTIRDGAYVRADETFVATVATAKSTILVEGNGALWDSDSDLILGSDTIATVGGTADLTIASGGTVRSGGIVKVHVGSNITMLGGTLEVAGNQDLVIDQTDGFDWHFGTLRYTGAATLGFSDLQTLLGTVPTLDNTKALEVGGIATLDSTIIIDGGTLRVGQLQGSSTPQFLNGTLQLTNDSLTIGLVTMFGPNLTLRSNRSLLVGNTLTVNAGSLLTVDQTTIFAGSLVNEGEIVINGASAKISGGSMNNMGLTTGNGRIALSLTNAASGTVRVNAGNHLIFDGGQNFNDGRIDLTGGTVEFTSLTQNNAAGLIVGQGTLISRLAFTNLGEMAFSGATNLVGDITNNATGLILVSGGAATTFFDDLTHNGELRTSTGSTSVFLGSVTGTGSFTGTGDNRFEGDFTPGASPADILFAGDVELTDSANLEIELLGTGGVPGIDFDRLDIAGSLDLAGSLTISLLGGYTPSLGDSFQVLNAATRNGTFGTILGADLGGGLMFDVIYGSSDVTLTVIGSAIPGDLDGDGFVGINDLNLVLGNWNLNVPPGNPLADPSGDGFVGINDLNTVLGNWNAGTPPTNTANIPEPGTVSLLTVTGLGLLRRSKLNRA